MSHHSQIPTRQDEEMVLAVKHQSHEKEMLTHIQRQTIQSNTKPLNRILKARKAWDDLSNPESMTPIKITLYVRDVVVHTFNPSSLGAEAGGSP